ERVDRLLPDELPQPRRRHGAPGGVVAVDRVAVLAEPCRKRVGVRDLLDLLQEVAARHVVVVILARKRVVDRRRVGERARTSGRGEREQRGRDEARQETFHAVERTGADSGGAIAASNFINACGSETPDVAVTGTITASGSTWARSD